MRAKIVLLALANLVISVDYNIVYVALPSIGHDVGFSPPSLQWVVSAFAVGFGGFLLLGGRAVDRLGARRMFVLALVLFGLASLGGGLAATPGVLIAARVAQGLGGALLFPATLALVNTGFAEGPERNRAIALWGVAGASGAIVGSMAGGFITAFLGWRWVFFINTPLTLAMAVAARRLLDPGPVRPAATGFDLRGALLGTAAATLAVLGLVDRGIAELLAGLLLAFIFVLAERRSPEPLAPGRLLRNRALVTAVAVIFVAQGVLNTLHYIFYLHLESVLGLSPLQAGAAFLPMSLLAVLGSARLLPFLLGRFGLRGTLAAGLLGVAAATALLAAGMARGGSLLALAPGGLAWGLFAGMLYPAVFVAAGTGAAAEEQGVSAALTNTAGQIGGAIGLAGMVAVATAGGGLAGAGFAAAGLGGLGTLLVLVLPRRALVTSSE